MCENEVKSAYNANLPEKINMENWKRHVDDYRYELHHIQKDWYDS